MMTIEHAVEIAVVVWPVVSGAANMVLDWKTADEWLAFADKHPRLHALVMLLRRLGLDPRDVVIYAKRLVAPKRKEKADA
jgi:hypothetical protein